MSMKDDRTDKQRKSQKVTIQVTLQYQGIDIMVKQQTQFSLTFTNFFRSDLCPSSDCRLI